MQNKKNWLERNICLPVLAHPEAEKENSLSHAFGAILSLIGLIYIVFNLDTVASFNLKIGLVIFAFANFLLYLSSTLYHGLPKNNAKRIFRILDHSNIYVLIAGTYTPLLLYVNSEKSINLFYFLWIIVLLGISLTIIFWGKFKILHVLFYLVMGWLIVFFWQDITPFLPKGLLTYVLTGGILYSLGVIFYALKKMPHNHLIWHIFCLVASLSFYIGILKYIL